MKLIKRNLLSKKLSIFIHVRRFLCIIKILHKSNILSHSNIFVYQQYFLSNSKIFVYQQYFFSISNISCLLAIFLSISIIFVYQQNLFLLAILFASKQESNLVNFPPRQYSKSIILALFFNEKVISQQKENTFNFLFVYLKLDMFEKVNKNKIRFNLFCFLM